MGGCDIDELPVITDRDIVCRSLGQGRNPLELTARDCMTRSVISVSPGASLEGDGTNFGANSLQCKKMRVLEISAPSILDKNLIGVPPSGRIC